MHDTGCSGLVQWDDPEGWDREGGGRGFRMGNTCTPMMDSTQCMARPIQYCKVKKKRIKCLGINLLRETKDLSSETIRH